ncbi:NAD(P)-binding protein [Microbacterium sp. SORGH_AS_0888]|uniref:oxidoreductase n=1 Tax=Microbacterium sp. SORGH_AS_0888 TaxID=3041791 RepID=UPI0027864FF8|nr:NAD(P)-binding protein [Microbacterium sp. SORGH_AS_0888]MDQ1130326.1 2,4-dienoyl-CoA reductase-like NADH-dependent reductase (Old Yellow Enzyme family) [Microbacterium sp. SORGH_AS_0888]
MSIGIASPLFEPLRIGALEVPNRIMQTAHSKQYSDRVESDRETAYYVRRAEGGCGLFIAGNHFVHPSGSIRNFEDAFRPESVESNLRMTEAVHAAGARIMVQLNHHGAQAQPDGPDGPRPVLAPSRLISPSTQHATVAATAADIRELVAAWARSAEYARLGGFDGVEIHLAHGYLLHQFLSPLYNARVDEYGGGIEGRTRFAREVLVAVRQRVGDDYPVGVRIVANEHHPQGLGTADMIEVIAALRAEARIDFLDLAAGGYHNVHYVFPSSAMPAAWLREDVTAIKRANPDVPVFGVGAALSVEQAEEVLTAGIADMVALTRAQIADPDLARKLRDGRTDEIRHCIRLNQGCLGRGSRGLPVSCTVNPLAGRELERPNRSASSLAQRWLVVGGGPAGMRAAVELAEDGHAVTLVEADDRLGGQLRLARRVPGRESIGLLVSDLVRDLDAAGVEVRRGLRIDGARLDALVAAEHFDGVVMATGATSPEGTSLALGGAYVNGFPPAGTVSAFRALADPAALGRRVLAVDADGTAYASGVVLSLLAQVPEVEVVTPFEAVFPHVGPGYDRPLLLERCGAHPGFRRTTAHRVLHIEGAAVKIQDVVTGEVSERVGIDTILAIEPRQAAPTWHAAGVRTVTIGDARAPRNIDAAIYDAVELAYAVAGASV